MELGSRKNREPPHEYSSFYNSSIQNKTQQLLTLPIEIHLNSFDDATMMMKMMM
jgi:hypothetical protein